MTVDPIHWYQLPVEEVFEKLKADSNGLGSEEALRRLEQYGPNEIRAERPSIFRLFLRQFNNPLVYVLLMAATITGILTLRGEHMLVDTSVILAVVILNVILGFTQEGKTEKALEALRQMMASECMVLRDGEQKIIPTRDMVPGDVVLLNSGDRISADLRLFYARDVGVDESALTGESVPVEKNIHAIAKTNLSPGDQLCMAFSGTFLTRGSAKGVVVATGSNTEFGKIAGLMKSTRRSQTPLQNKIADFTKTLIVAILFLGALSLVLGYSVGYGFSYSFLAAIALIVAAMPEMLPMLVTSILALSASAMAKRNALIRSLPAAETLGSTTVICSDKTGTLTRNEMTVVKIYAGEEVYSVGGVGYEPSGEFCLRHQTISPLDHAVLSQTLRAGLLCNDAVIRSEEDKHEILGDPTEGALVVAASKAGITEKPPRIDEIPFSSDYMYMATLHPEESGNVIYLKGSPEAILPLCHSQLTENDLKPLIAEDIHARTDEMAAEGLRVIAMAFKSIPADQRYIGKQDLTELIFLGLQGMIDPPRKEAIEAVGRCKKAGIRTVMITGDHVKTAMAIAVQLGIVSSSRDTALTGQQLAAMTDDQLYEVVDEVSVYARVAPEHKLRIARQLQRRGQVVAMTGDGVNDAPALRAADIGIAMGITGTEVSKEAAAMILTDDNFASIVAAVEEGRHAWNNLEKAILYTLPTNGGQSLLIMAAILLSPFVSVFAAGLPLEPIQILWINLFDSVFLTMPLMLEPKEKGLLEVPPRSPGAKIANRLFFERVGLVSLIIATTGFWVYWNFGHIALSSGEGNLAQAQTAAFMSIVLVHLGYVLTARSIFNSAFTFSPFSNRWLLSGIGITVVTNLLIVYAPFMNSVFRTEPFPLAWWPYVIGAFFLGFFIPEIEKWFRRRAHPEKL
ncbi:MAG: HAD-IC family P-type ATPase [Dehalococcoidia bacterium]|nr:HAD-IC family P-type ATPase [Dehalococcoidia bacterium]